MRSLKMEMKKGTWQRCFNIYLKVQLSWGKSKRNLMKVLLRNQRAKTQILVELPLEICYDKKSRLKILKRIQESEPKFWALGRKSLEKALLKWVLRSLRRKSLLCLKQRNENQREKDFDRLSRMTIFEQCTGSSMFQIEEVKGWEVLTICHILDQPRQPLWANELIHPRKTTVKR